MRTLYFISLLLSSLVVGQGTPAQHWNNICASSPNKHGTTVQIGTNNYKYLCDTRTTTYTLYGSTNDPAACVQKVSAAGCDSALWIKDGRCLCATGIITGNTGVLMLQNLGPVPAPAPAPAPAPGGLTPGNRQCNSDIDKNKWGIAWWKLPTMHYVSIQHAKKVKNPQPPHNYETGRTTTATMTECAEWCYGHNQCRKADFYGSNGLCIGYNLPPFNRPANAPAGVCEISIKTRNA